MPRVSSSDGVVVDYLCLGGSGPRLLLAHATGFSATAWRPLADALASDFECWALDFRGHGRSGRPADGRFDWHGTADDLLAVIDAVDAAASGAPWFGAGHSMGGAGLLLAEQRRPETFAGLWVYEPIVFPGSAYGATDDGNVLAEGAARRRATFSSRQAAFDNYASKPPMDVFDPRALAGYLERGLVDEPDGVRLACRPEDEAQVYRMGGRHSAWDRLDEVACPTTVVVGAEEEFGPSRAAPPVAARLADGRLERHPELGHFGPLQAPEAMAASIRAAFAAAADPASLSDPRPTIGP